MIICTQLIDPINSVRFEITLFVFLRNYVLKFFFDLKIIRYEYLLRDETVKQ